MTTVITTCGSLRKGSYNAALARQLPGFAPPGMSIKPAPAWDKMPIYNHDIQASTGFPADAETWAAAIRAADGVIFNSPEYNFSIPGGLKNAIDWVSRVPNQPFAGKPVALQSATNGPLGGGRMQYDLRRCMLFLDAPTFGRPEIFIGNASQRIDAATGQIIDETTKKLIGQQLAAFAKFIERHGGKT